MHFRSDRAIDHDQLEVVSVSGTELVVRIPDDMGASCSVMGELFRVVLFDSSQEATGGSFTVFGDCKELFTDGFESGDTSEWSAVVGETP